MISKSQISIDTMYKMAHEHEKLLSLTIELNNTCNWNCIHCYIPCHNNHGLDTDQIIGILQQARLSGVFDIIFTGGEIFLRKDILYILKKARNEGFRVSILSNASLIDENVANEISKLNISNFSVTIFSLNEEIHNSIAMNSKAFANAMKGINALYSNGVKIELKTPIMEKNRNEYKTVAKYAKKMGFSFTCSPIIFPKTNGCNNPINLMMSELEMQRHIREIDALMEFTPREKNCEEVACSVLGYSLFISSEGKVFPCGSFPIELGNIYEKSLESIWNSRLAKRIRALKIKDLKECNSCEKYSHCNCCPGIAFMETEDFLSCSPICKKIAKCRGIK